MPVPCHAIPSPWEHNTEISGAGQGIRNNTDCRLQIADCRPDVVGKRRGTNGVHTSTHVLSCNVFSIVPPPPRSVKSPRPVLDQRNGTGDTTDRATVSSPTPSAQTTTPMNHPCAEERHWPDRWNPNLLGRWSPAPGSMTVRWRHHATGCAPTARCLGVMPDYHMPERDQGSPGWGSRCGQWLPLSVVRGDTPLPMDHAE
jgi:hypothetical protein